MLRSPPGTMRTSRDVRPGAACGVESGLGVWGTRLAPAGCTREELPTAERHLAGHLAARVWNGLAARSWLALGVGASGLVETRPASWVRSGRPFVAPAGGWMVTRATSATAARDTGFSRLFSV